jgi:mono/diheme cytochrome c family protein/plastocyanin
MTDTPDRPPEERLPATRPEPSIPAPADRFSSPPSARKFELTPERAAGIVRQSASARWVGFLAVSVVALFVIGYYFYELGLPEGWSKPRLVMETEAQQVRAVERGYNIYQANCAQCHGADGQGGKGPTLHRQDKLFDHLNEEYLNAVLVVGGRYVCGDPNSIMPIWSDQGHPPGPLNYVQIEELIAFLRSDATKEYEVRDAALNEPVKNADGSVKKFKGWVDPAYQPEPNATPYPDCWTKEFTNPQPSGSAAPSGSAPAPSGSAATGTTIDISAAGVKFEQAAVSAPADAAFKIAFDNKDAGQLHNVEIKDSSGTSKFRGDIITGPATTTYDVPALAAGSYTFVCTVHPTMTGTLTAG